MLLTMLFDEEDEEYVSALFKVGDKVLQLKQKPHEGRFLDKAKEEQQEYAMAHPDEGAGPSSSANGEYDSAFPNVGLVVWQAGFVLAEYLVRAQPEGPWPGKTVLELGCGTGQLGIVLALAGAAVTLTDLAHIVPLTQTNVDLNASRCSIQPVCAPYYWGTPVADIPRAPAQQQQQEEEEEQPQQQQEGDSCASIQQQGGQQQQQQAQCFDVIVAADVLYEPQYFDLLLNSLMQLCPSPSQQQQGGQPAADRPPPPLYMCYRVRRYAESSFEAKAAACGFEVTHVPVEQLHPDYQCGGYRLIRLNRQ